MSKIDVSECEYYNCGDCFVEPQVGYCGEFRGYGKCDNKDCYYKQLQQLKVENKKLKKEIKELKRQVKVARFFLNIYKNEYIEVSSREVKNNE